MNNRIANLFLVALFAAIASGGCIRTDSPGEVETFRPDVDGFYYHVVSGDSLSSIARAQGIKVSDIVKYNDIANPDLVDEGFLLYIPAPGKKLVERPPVKANKKPLVPTHPDAALPGYIWPLIGGSISGRFGSMADGLPLKGINIDAPTGEPVYCVSGGTVVFCSAKGVRGFGRVVIVRQNDGYRATYAHLDKLFITDGMRISKGVPIGSIGADARSRKGRLHFRLTAPNGTEIDPLSRLKRAGT